MGVFVTETKVSEYDAYGAYNIVVDTLAVQPTLYRARVYRHWVNRDRGDWIEALEIDRDFRSYDEAFEAAEDALLKHWRTDNAAWDWQE